MSEKPTEPSDPAIEEARERVRALRAEPEEDGYESQVKWTKRDKRIHVIIGMMADRTWEGVASCRVLAEDWNLTLWHVKELAKDAAMIQRWETARSPEMIQAELEAGLDLFQLVTSRAIQLGHETKSAHALNVAMQATALRLQYLGLKPPQKNEHSGPGGKPLGTAQVLVLPEIDHEALERDSVEISDEPPEG